MFTLTKGMAWLAGYDFWVPPGGDTAPAGGFKWATWDVYANTTQVLVADSSVSAATLTAGTMNRVLLGTPIQLAPGETYVAATGWTATNGIPLSSGQFGSGNNYASGITNGPLTAWPNMGSGGSSPFPWATSFNYGQGLFASNTSGLGPDPTVNMPNNGSGSDLFWISPVISTTPPSVYSGSYRLRPNAHGLGSTTDVVEDTPNDFNLAVEFSLSQACAVNYIWFYSPPALTQLPTEISIYEVSGQTLVARNASPSWSGTAGSGWIKAAFTGNVTLQPGVSYKACVLNGAGSPAIWNDAIASFWNPGGGASGGFGGGGLTAGPLAYPDTSTATSPGQASYNAGGTQTFPDTNAGPFDYGVDIEVTPSAAAAGPSLLMASFP